MCAFTFITNCDHYETSSTSNLNRKCEVKMLKSPLETSRGHRQGVKIQFYSLLSSALDGGEWSTPRPRRFTTGKETR